MNIKSIFLTALSIAICTSAIAQDKIYKRNGDMIEGKVKEINRNTISYQRADNLNGPVYVIEKGTVDRIEYQNGTEEMMNGRRMSDSHQAGKRSKVKYGNNIIAVSPIQINDGVGVGLSYERMLDKKGIVSFYLPATWAFITNDNNAPYPYNGVYGQNSNHSTFFVMPGVKIYPTGSKGIVRYAVGPSIAIVTGKEYVEDSYYLSQYPYPTYYGGSYKDRFSLGMMVNNSLNITPTPHLYLGLELGLGVTYIHQVGGINRGEEFLGQFGFKLGYRF